MQKLGCHPGPELLKGQDAKGPGRAALKEASSSKEPGGPAVPAPLGEPWGQSPHLGTCGGHQAHLLPPHAPSAPLSSPSRGQPPLPR